MLEKMFPQNSEMRPEIRFAGFTDDWEQRKLGELSERTFGGGTPNTSNNEYWNGDIPWIRTTEVQNCILNLEDTQEFITKEGLKNSSAKLVPVGTVLLAMIGQGKTRGQVAYLNFEASTNQNCATIIFDKNSEPKFYYQYLLSQYENIRGISNSAGQSNLSGSLVKAIKVPVPPLKEQIQIAETLSTWDNAIQTTEGLLENSRQQKKALMQRLLKGNNWLQADLAELAVISKGSQLNKNTLSDNGQYAVINGGIEPSGYTDKFNTESHTITISEGGNSCGYIGFQKEKFWCGGHCYALSNLRINCLFLYQLLKYNEENIMRLRVGSGLSNIQKKALESFSLSYPQDISEQQKIAEILSTADQEIETLQRKLECLKLEKGALMQRFL